MTQQMAYLSAALQTILDATGWNQRQFAEKCGVPAPQLNRYLRGVNRVPIESAEKLLAAVPEEHRPNLLKAYLQDSIPHHYEQLVTILPAGGTVREDEAVRLPDGIDPEMKKMVELFASYGMRHTQVRDMMRSFLRIVAPDQIS